MMNKPSIRLDDLQVSRGGRRVLNGISGTIERGSLVGLLGASGSGKTTLMRAIVGVQVIESGTVEVLGRPAGHAELRSKVGYVTQAPSVYPDLTVLENLRYFAAVLGAPSGDAQRVLATTGLETSAHAVTAALSGGQRARVSLATALLGQPELLVLDEPTVGLDPVLRRDLWQVFGDLARSGTTLLVSSHVMDEAQRCERLLILRNGTLLVDDSPEALLARTRAPDLEAAFLFLAEETGTRT